MSPGLQSGIFTTSAIDNIIHSQSSDTAKIFFYGTSITAFQHPDMPIKKQDFSFDFKTDRDDSSPSVLPTSYTLMVPSKAGKLEPPNSTQQKISKSAHVNEW